MLYVRIIFNSLSILSVILLYCLLRILFLLSYVVFFPFSSLTLTITAYSVLGNKVNVFFILSINFYASTKKSWRNIFHGVLNNLFISGSIFINRDFKTNRKFLIMLNIVNY